MKTHKSNMSRKKSKDSKHTSSTFVEISYRISAICVLCFFIGCSQLIDNGKGPLSLIPGLSVFSDGESPRVIGSWPMNDQTIADPKAALSISFSKEMNQTFPLREVIPGWVQRCIFNPPSLLRILEFILSPFPNPRRKINKAKT